jgi:chaperonin cofactor prefoldin
MKAPETYRFMFNNNVTTDTELQQKIGSLIFSLKSEREKRKLEREESILSMRLERQARKREIDSMLSSFNSFM